MTGNAATTSDAPTPPERAAIGDPSPRSDGTEKTAGGGIERLNAFDGLFLRAEHLTVMQDYAQQLAHAVGAAGGPGVVEGFDVTRTDDGVRVGPGLAVDRAGRPLRSRFAITVPWSELETGLGDYFVIELLGASWTFGDAAVQALLCNAPCSGGTRERPFAADGVRVRRTARTLDAGTGPPDSTQFRSWLADQLFAKEAEAAGRWPEAGDESARTLDGRRWVPDPAPVPTGEPAVPLAVLLPTTNSPLEWPLDIWAVRRDCGSPPPEDHWRWRLGMRPWNVFVAQMLQFQDQLAADYLPRVSGKLAPSIAEVLDELRRVGGELNVRHPKLNQPRNMVRDLIARFEGGAGMVLAEAPTLPQSGFVALPPAGLLPVQGKDDDAVLTEMSRLVGDGVAVLLGGRCSVSEVGDLIEQARHRPRVALPGGTVEIFIPTDGTGRSTDWVVFRGVGGVRPTRDRVDVYVIDHGQNQESFNAAVGELRAGRLPDNPGSATVLQYPADSWAQPEGSYADLRTRIEDLTGRCIAVAMTSEPSRRPLGTVRAALLGVRHPDNGPVDVPETFAMIADYPGVEVVVVMSRLGD